MNGTNESEPKAILLCADGKGPLLEGEGDVLPCLHDCPDGFDCERLRHTPMGICCPNLAALNRLYNNEKLTQNQDKASRRLRRNAKSLFMEANNDKVLAVILISFFFSQINLFRHAQQIHNVYQITKIKVKKLFLYIKIDMGQCPNHKQWDAGIFEFDRKYLVQIVSENLTL